MLALSVLSVRSASAQVITVGDFGPSAVTDTFTGLGLPFFNLPPLVRPEGVYTVDSAQFRYADFGPQDSIGEAFSNDSATGFINIALTAPAFRVGLFVGASDADVSFFDASNNLLHTTAVIGTNVAPVFAGFQSNALVSRILIQDTGSNVFVVIVDNVTTEAFSPIPSTAPEPGSLVLAACGLLPLAGIALRRGRRRA